MDRMSALGAHAGFTLMELLLVVSLLAASLLWVLPAAGQWIATVRLQSAADQFVAALNRARSEALSRGIPVTVCPTSGTGENLRCGHDYGNGWLLFSDGTAGGEYVAARDRLLAVSPPLHGGVEVSNASGRLFTGVAISYLPDGSARRTMTQQFCAVKMSAVRAVAVIVNVVGRARTVKRAGACGRQL